MGIWDIFKKKQKSVSQPAATERIIKSKDDIYKMVFEQMMKKPPSDLFASGSVFDIVRQKRDDFMQAIRSCDALQLHKCFVEAYTLFCNNPQIVNVPPAMVNTNNNDTNPGLWNADTFSLENGDAVALCYMPIRSETLEARMIGVVFSDKGDGYYYCMLNKDKDALSVVKRNRAMLGTTKAGEIKGRGFELMGNFRSCIQKDFYSSTSDYV